VCVYFNTRAYAPRCVFPVLHYFLLQASSKVAAAVVALQRQLPLARVLYASATGVSDISNLVYADRLGLWGAGSPFRDFSAFDAFVAKRGLGGLEMLAMEMKSSGM